MTDILPSALMAGAEAGPGDRAQCAPQQMSRCTDPLTLVTDNAVQCHNDDNDDNDDSDDDSDNGYNPRTWAGAPAGTSWPPSAPS